MNDPAIPALQSRPSRTALFAAAILGLLVCGITLNFQSYWIDEAGAVYRASLPTVREWWHQLSVTDRKDADNQLPLYMIFSWVWEKIAGHKEWAFRAGNIPWFLAGFLAASSAFCGEKRRRWTFLGMISLSPFVWYYLGEARAYGMQIGLSLLVFSSLWRLSRLENDPGQERRWMAALCVGSWLLSASGLLAMLWCAAYLAGAIASSSFTRLRKLARSYPLELAITGLSLFVLGLYYLWTMKAGSRSTLVASTNFKTIIFIGYELLGFSGLGPGRAALRAGSLDVLIPWLPLLGIYGVLLAAVIAAGVRSMAVRLPRRTLLAWSLSFAGVLGFILAVGLTVRFRVLGRHCAPLLPVLLFVTAAGVSAWLETRGTAKVVIIGAFAGLSLFSCLSMRFCARHWRDDYRSAAAQAAAALARGEIVWWNANHYGAMLYHLPVAEKPVDPAKAAFLVVNPETGFDHQLMKPGLVVASKPDVYDSQGALAAYLKNNGFCPVTNFAAFTVWRPPN